MRFPAARCPVCEEMGLTVGAITAAFFGSVARCSACGSAVNASLWPRLVSSLCIPLAIAALFTSQPVVLLAAVAAGLALIVLFVPLQPDVSDPVTGHRLRRAELRAARTSGASSDPEKNE